MKVLELKEFLSMMGEEDKIPYLYVGKRKFSDDGRRFLVYPASEVTVGDIRDERAVLLFDKNAWKNSKSE